MLNEVRFFEYLFNHYALYSNFSNIKVLNKLSQYSWGTFLKLSNFAVKKNNSNSNIALDQILRKFLFILIVKCFLIDITFQFDPDHP